MLTTYSFQCSESFHNSASFLKRLLAVGKTNTFYGTNVDRQHPACLIAKLTFRAKATEQ